MNISRNISCRGLRLLPVRSSTRRACSCLSARSLLMGRTLPERSPAPPPTRCKTMHRVPCASVARFGTRLVWVLKSARDLPASPGVHEQPQGRPGDPRRVQPVRWRLGQEPYRGEARKGLQSAWQGELSWGGTGACIPWPLRSLRFDARRPATIASSSLKSIPAGDDVENVERRSSDSERGPNRETPRVRVEWTRFRVPLVATRGTRG